MMVENREEESRLCRKVVENVGISAKVLTVYIQREKEGLAHQLGFSHRGQSRKKDGL